jgi:hypothetical protein
VANILINRSSLGVVAEGMINQSFIARGRHHGRKVPRCSYP